MNGNVKWISVIWWPYILISMHNEIFWQCFFYFQFIPFAERINSIDIRHAALYHIEHSYSKQPEENETHFHLAIQKWHVLNLTENFKKFKKEIFGVVTVPQLVHKKDEVLDTLEKYLKLEDHLCLQPLLEWVKFDYSFSLVKRY